MFLHLLLFKGRNIVIVIFTRNAICDRLIPERFETFRRWERWANKIRSTSNEIIDEE